MHNSLQRTRKDLIYFIHQNKESGRLKDYDLKKLKEYMSTAEENGRFTPYEIAHIDRMYEEVMGGLTGMKVPPKHDIRPLGLRY